MKFRLKVDLVCVNEDYLGSKFIYAKIDWAEGGMPRSKNRTTCSYLKLRNIFKNQFPTFIRRAKMESLFFLTLKNCYPTHYLAPKMSYKVEIWHVHLVWIPHVPFRGCSYSYQYLRVSLPTIDQEKTSHCTPFFHFMNG